MSVMFIAEVHSDKGIEIDTSYMPFIISGCTSKFQRHPYACFDVGTQKGGFDITKPTSHSAPKKC